MRWRTVKFESGGLVLDSYFIPMSSRSLAVYSQTEKMQGLSE